MRISLVEILCLTTALAGCSGSSNAPAPLPPVANAGGPYAGTAGTALSFSGGGSSDPQGQALTYAWNFGDGTSGTGVTPSHTYAVAGTFTVSLTATNTSSLTGTATSKAVIVPAPLPPVANAGGPYAGTAGTALSFSGGGSSDPQGQALTYAWNFGDGTNGTGVTPSHTYAAAGTYTVSLTATNTSSLTGTATSKAVIVPAPLAGIAISGVVSGGVQPISGAHVYLLAANTTGYGQGSVSLLNAANTGSSDAVGAYAATDANGKFNLATDYACTSGQQLYLYALGGNTGSFVNTASGLLAALGSCPTTAVSVTVNEVTTVAAAYAFAGFAVDATHVSSSGTALAQVGVANAFATAGNLASLATGTALATTPAGNGTVPQVVTNSLANLLAGCVVSGTSCNTLLSTATLDGTSTGAKAGDTASVAINIAHHPGMNVASLYALSLAASTFVPALTSQPSDFTVVLTFVGGGLAYTINPNFQNAETGIAIDGFGNVWVNGSGEFNVFSSLGSVLFGKQLCCDGAVQGRTIAIDPGNNAWIAAANSLHKVSNSGVELSPTGYPSSGYVSVPGPIIYGGLAIDGNGSVWLAQTAGPITEVTNAGVVISPSGGYQTGGAGAIVNGPVPAIDAQGNVWVGGEYVSSPTYPSIYAARKISQSGVVLSPAGGYQCGGGALAIDASGNAWIVATYQICKVSNTGTSTVYPAGGAFLVNAGDIAIDGAGNVWSPTDSSYPFGIVELSSTGAVLSPMASTPNSYSVGFALYALDTPLHVALDGSGNIWVTNTENVLNEIVGLAVPVVTPLSVGVKNNTLGTRP